jgi:hypothetical protein
MIVEIPEDMKPGLNSITRKANAKLQRLIGSLNSIEISPASHPTGKSDTSVDGSLP